MECKCTIYTILSCLFPWPLCRIAETSQGWDISIYLYIIYQMFTLPILLRVCFSSQKVTGNEKGMLMTRDEAGHGSRGLILVWRWWLSWILRRPHLERTTVSHVCFREMGYKIDADWTVPVAGTRDRLGSHRWPAARSRYLFGYLLRTYARARADIPLEVEHRPTPEIEGIPKLRFVGVMLHTSVVFPGTGARRRFHCAASVGAALV